MDREAAEQLLKRRLLAKRQEQLALLTRAMGRPPDPRKIPARVWRTIERDHRDDLFWMLYVAYLGSHVEAWDQLGRPALDARPSGHVPQRAGQGELELPHDATLGAELAADRWAGATAKRIAGGMVKTARGRLAVARAGARGAEPPDYAAELAGLLGEPRMETVAVTETTRAINAGYRELAVAVKQRYPETGVELYWITAGDERVCQVCAPMNGRPEPWFNFYLGGPPPAHPRCRCGLQVRAITITGELVASTPAWPPVAA